MPLVIEVYNPHVKEWVKAGGVSPSDPPGSMSHNTPDGSRELYIFECARDDREAVIYVVTAAADLATREVREILSNRREWQVVKILQNNQTFELTVRTDVSLEGRTIRFCKV